MKKHLPAEELLELRKELDRLEKIKKDKAVYFFKPNPPQARMTIHGDRTFRCLFGANKVGKSTWGVIEDISFCLGYRPYLPKTHEFYKTPFVPPVKGVVFGETWDKADEVLTPHFTKWMPTGVAEPIRGHGRTIGWQFKNGSEIKYGTYEMDTARFEGADKHFYHFDEPPPYSLWTPVTRGIVVNKGMIWLTLTLLKEGWIWDEIWEKWEQGNPNYFATTGTIQDNLAREDGSGALSEEAIELFEDTLDDVQKEVRLYGKPQHLQGRIFKHFQLKEPWVVEPWEIPDAWPAVRAFDPHMAKPIAGLWGRVAPSGRLIITDELYDRKVKTMDDLRSRVERIERDRKHTVRLSLMDSWSSQKDLNDKSVIDHFKEYGIHCQPAPKQNKIARLLDTAERFKIDNFTGQPNVVIFKTCDRLIWEIKRYVHPELKNRSRDERWKEFPEGRDKKDDDLIDCLLYLVSKDPRFESLTHSETAPWIMSPDRDGGEGDAPIFAEEYTESYAGRVRDAVQDSNY